MLLGQLCETSPLLVKPSSRRSASQEYHMPVESKEKPITFQYFNIIQDVNDVSHSRENNLVCKPLIFLSGLITVIIQHYCT